MQPFQIKVDRGEDLNSKRLSGIGVDVNFVVEKKEFHAHRSIVGLYSPFLKALTDPRSTFVEGEQDKIVLRDIKVEHFEQILNYIYTGKIFICRDNVLELIAMANYLQLEDDFVGSCIEVLGQCLASYTLEEFFAVWSFSEQFHLPTLRQKALVVLGYRLEEFFKEAYEKIWFQLKYEDVHSILVSKSLCFRNEKHLFDALIQWISRHEDDASTEQLKELLGLCDISLLNPKYLKNSLNVSRLSEEIQTLSKSLSVPSRNCSTCVYVFQYHRDTKDILGIEEFLDQRSREVAFALFDPNKIGKEKKIISDLNCITNGESFHRHYGPQAIAKSVFKNTDEHLVSFGGTRNKSGSIANEIKQFDLQSGTWMSTKGSLPLHIVQFGCEILGHYCYIFGGMLDSTNHGNLDKNISSQVFRKKLSDLHNKLSKWERLEDMPHKWASFCSTNNGFKIFVIGNNQCDIFWPSENTWTSIPEAAPCDVGRHPVCTILGTTLYLFGDRTDSGINRFLELDTEDLIWKSIPNISLRFDVKSAFTHNSKIYLIGYSAASANSFFCFNPKRRHPWSCELNGWKGSIGPGTLIRGHCLSNKFPKLS